MTTNLTIDYGYPWWLSYGHLAIFVPFAAGVVMGWLRGWPRWVMVVLAALSLWAGAAWMVTRSFSGNDVVPLPTESFLRGGEGKVLDMGAGTGRSAIMVLKARPKATLVASDLFGNSFQQHFGEQGTPQERLLANLKAAGVDGRATIEKADMRKLPFGDASFDAVVSAYAVDHLGREGSGQALREALRVVKPGGEFLLILVANDKWMKFAYGPMLTHGGTRGGDWWKQRTEEAGFETVEIGGTTGTLYLLLRRPGGI